MVTKTQLGIIACLKLKCLSLKYEQGDYLFVAIKLPQLVRLLNSVLEKRQYIIEVYIYLGYLSPYTCALLFAYYFKRCNKHIVKTKNLLKFKQVGSQTY